MKPSHALPRLLMHTFVVVLLCSVNVPSTLAANPSATDSNKGIEFFETKIRPVLVQKCYGCHSSEAKSPKGGLLLDSKGAMLAGGDSGPAVVPKNAGESLLIGAIRYEDFEMPPKEQLPDSVIADFEAWVAMGAPDPRNEPSQPVRREIDIEAGREFWAFRSLVPTPPPRATGSKWATTEIDQYVAAHWKEAGLKPVQDADASTWLRRVTFDLVGLPPTEEELDDFLSAAKTDIEAAKQKVVDRLLDSRHFGERWGRHWLDIARYAESTGRTRNYPFPFAWRYRDYVIQSFNDDTPYDQFVVEQLAGDLLSSDNYAQRERQLVATGFLAVGSPDLNERDAKVYQMDTIADQIDTTTRALLGLTVGCARCHDHKFDPIPTEDYYALAGIFKSTDLLNGYSHRKGGNNKARGDLLIPLGESIGKPPKPPTPEEIKNQEKLEAAKKVKAAAAARVAQVKNNKDLTKKQRAKQLAQAKRTLSQKNRAFNQVRRKIEDSTVTKFEGPACLGVREAKKVVNCNVHIAGETNRLGDAVDRGFLQVIASSSQTSIPNDQSGRLELARWIVDPNNPLTARVMVNRVWRQLFGRGIVRTVDNFGLMGDRPTHPALLDHLAHDFIEDGWSVKRLIKKLVMTRTYGLDVTHDDANASIDENNTKLWRMNSRRLEYEAIRDAMLLVSGRLDYSAPTGSYVESLKVNEISRQKAKVYYPAFTHRSVYLPVMRNLIPEEMSYFDFPESSETKGARDTTTVPTQSLFLLNSRFVIGLSRATAKQLLSQEQQDDELLVRTAYRRILAREVEQRELTQVREYVKNRTAELVSRNLPKVKPNAKKRKRQEIVWSEIVHAMFASAEFRYR